MLGIRPIRVDFERTTGGLTGDERAAGVPRSHGGDRGRTDRERTRSSVGGVASSFVGSVGRYRIPWTAASVSRQPEGLATCVCGPVDRPPDGSTGHVSTPRIGELDQRQWNARPESRRPLRVPIDPRTERIEIVGTGTFRTIPERPRPTFVVQRHRHPPSIVVVRRVFVVQLRVIARRPSPLESADIDEDRHDLSAGNRAASNPTRGRRAVPARQSRSPPDRSRGLDVPRPSAPGRDRPAGARPHRRECRAQPPGTIPASSRPSRRLWRSTPSSRHSLISASWTGPLLEELAIVPVDTATGPIRIRPVPADAVTDAQKCTEEANGFSRGRNPIRPTPGVTACRRPTGWTRGQTGAARGARRERRADAHREPRLRIERSARPRDRVVRGTARDPGDRRPDGIRT